MSKFPALESLLGNPKLNLMAPNAPVNEDDCYYDGLEIYISQCVSDYLNKFEKTDKKSTNESSTEAFPGPFKHLSALERYKKQNS